MEKVYTITSAQLERIKAGYIEAVTNTKGIKLVNGKPCLVEVVGSKTPDYTSVVLPIESKPDQLMLSNEEAKQFYTLKQGEKMEVYRKTVFDANGKVLEKAKALAKDSEGNYLDSEKASYYLSHCKHIEIARDGVSPVIVSQWDGDDRSSQARYTIVDNNPNIALRQEIKW